MSSETDLLLQGELEPRERIIWSERAGLLTLREIARAPEFRQWATGLAFVSSTAAAMAVLFAIQDGAVSMRLSFPMSLGFFAMAGGWALESWRRAHTVYGLTNERLLVVEASGFFDRKASKRLLDIVGVGVSELGAGRGTLSFGERGEAYRQLEAVSKLTGRSGEGPPVPKRMKFFAIPDAKAVADLIDRQRAAAAEG